MIWIGLALIVYSALFFCDRGSVSAIGAGFWMAGFGVMMILVGWAFNF